MSWPAISLETLITAVRAALMLISAVAVGALVARVARRFATERFSPAQAEVAGRLVFGLSVLLGGLSALTEIGFDLSVFMGAAGLLTVAVGFASQTSASNLISGLFLLFERPFAIRDTIRIGATTGEVVSIDLLSVRLRTFDNLLVRVPNETLLKSEITNLSHFPIRRFDLLVVVPVSVDLEQVREVLLEASREEVLVLDEPEPVVHFVGFPELGAQLQVSVWAARADYVAVKNDLPLHIHQALRAAGVEIAVPQRIVHAR